VECDLLNKTIEMHRSTIGEYLNQNQMSVKYRQESIVERLHVPAFEPLFLELQSFVDAIANDQPVIVTATDGLHAVEVADAVREALKPHLVEFDLNHRHSASLPLPVTVS
jgi:predicted dehydrogenase